MCKAQAGQVKLQAGKGEAPLSTPPLEDAFESILPEGEASPKQARRSWATKGPSSKLYKLSRQKFALKL